MDRPFVRRAGTFRAFGLAVCAVLALVTGAGAIQPTPLPSLGEPENQTPVKLPELTNRLENSLDAPLAPDDVVVVRLVDKGPPPLVSFDVSDDAKRYGKAIFSTRQVKETVHLYHRTDKRATELDPIKPGVPRPYAKTPLLVVLDPDAKNPFPVSFATYGDINFESKRRLQNGKIDTQIFPGGNYRYLNLHKGTIDEVKSGEPWGYETIFHELGHAVMFASHREGKYWPNGPTTYVSHTFPMKTDPAFAFTEGWAEFFAAFYTGSSYGDYSSDAAGNPKPMMDLLSTEGWISQTLCAIARDPEINRGDPRRALDMLVRSNVEHHPKDVGELLMAVALDNPAAAGRISAIVERESRGAIRMQGGLLTAGDGRIHEDLATVNGGDRGRIADGGAIPEFAPAQPSVAPVVQEKKKKKNGTSRPSEDRQALYRRYLDAVREGRTDEIADLAARLRKE